MDKKLSVLSISLAVNTVIVVKLMDARKQCMENRNRNRRKRGLYDR